LVGSEPRESIGAILWSIVVRYLLPAVGLVIIIVVCLGLFYRNRARDRVSAIAPIEASPGMDRLWELLFADQSLSEFLSEQPAVAWPELREALEAGRQGKSQDAIATLKKALAEPNLETRLALLIWNSLRELGVSPSPGEAEVAQGVGVEIPLEGDAVALAVYRDGRARLFSWRGNALLWEPTGDTRITALLNQVLADGQALVLAAQPGRKCTPIPDGIQRVTLLTFGGIRTFDARKSDTLPIHASVTDLIGAFTAIGNRPGTKSVQPK